jgi:tetratricopeptide (TPR) repeat protein
MAGGHAKRSSAVVGPALTAALALAVHGRSVGFGLTGLDDRDLVVDDAAFLSAPGSVLRAFTRAYLHVVDPAHGYYRPMVTASLALDARWGEGHLFAYHATNVLLHAAASALFCVLLQELAMGARVALAGAAAYAVHPALASAVAWIPGRNDSMLAVFALAAWIALARDARSPAAGWKAMHLGAFFLALMTKETAVVLPVVFVAHLLCVGPADDAGAAGAGPRAWLLARRLPPYAIAWAVALVSFAALHGAVDARALGWTADSARVLVASAAQVLFAASPGALASPADMPVVPGLIAVAAIGAATTLMAGVRRRVVLLGAVTFVATLVPTLLSGAGPALACRLELPACGAILAASEIVRALAAARPAEGRRGLAALVAAGVGVLAMVTVAFEGSFRSPRAFAIEAVDDAPHAPLAHVCLGSVLQAAGDDDRAAAEYRAALALGPAEIAHNNLGVLAMSAGRWDEAERELRSELAIQPRYARAYRNLAIVLRHEGRDEEAGVAEMHADALVAP